MKYLRSLLAIRGTPSSLLNCSTAPGNLLAWLLAWGTRGHWHYLSTNHFGQFEIGALTLTLFLRKVGFSEAHRILHNDTTLGQGIHGMLTELMLQLDLERQTQIRNKVPKMWYMVA